MRAETRFIIRLVLMETVHTFERRAMNNFVVTIVSALFGFVLGLLVNHATTGAAASEQMQDAVALENRVYAACVVTVVGVAQSAVTAYEMRKIISQACDK